MSQQWIGPGLLALMGGWIIIGNWGILVYSMISGQKSSLVPLVGAVLVCAALVVAPGGKLAQYGWIPFLLDFGSAPIFILAAVYSGPSSTSRSREADPPD